MYPRGIIYKFGFPPFGVTRIHVPLKIRILYQGIRGVSAGLIAYAVIFGMFTYAPLVKQEINYRLGRASIHTPSTIDLAKAQSTAEVQAEAKSYGVDSYFSVVIPKIGAHENIIANVDASNEKEYLDALTEGVAHAAGTYFPGQGKGIYLFSHSVNSPLDFARYNAVFYLLRELEQGDRVIVFFADKKYVYEVSERRVVDPNDTSWITNAGKVSEEELVLQTCDPPGTTWKRLIVIAKRVS